MAETRLPTAEEKERINELSTKIMLLLVEHEATLVDIVKLSSIMVVNTFHLLGDRMSDEDYEQALEYYSNIATSSVKFLHDGEIPNGDEFTNFSGTLQ